MNPIKFIIDLFGGFFNSMHVQLPLKNIFTVIDSIYNFNAIEKQDVNIIGFRDELSPDTWNDLIVGNIRNKIIICQATTDPGIYYTNNPLDKNGAAHLPYGYY